MICTGKVVKELMSIVPKNAKWEDLVLFAEEWARMATQMATIKAMVDTKKEN